MEIKTWSGLAAELGIDYNKLISLKNNDLTAPKNKNPEDWKRFLKERTGGGSDDEVNDASITSSALEKLRYYKSERERLQLEKEKGLLVELRQVQEDERKRWATAKKHLLRLPTISGKLYGMTPTEMQQELSIQVEEVLQLILGEIEKESEE